MPAPAAVEAPAVVEAPKEAAKVEAPAVVEAPKETAKVEAPAAPVAVAQVSGEKVYATCIGCHGAQGEGGVGPKLAGQVVADVVDKLKRYKAGEQVGPMTGMMAPMATGLSEADMQAVAEYVTKL
ncbi:MAG: c-type cytochrome [Thiotrichales bacterium]|nr:c-type cytochrome [Thiotrichales bacterium]